MGSNGLLRRVLTMLGGNMAAVVLQAIQFILLARTLGATEFGVLAAVNALVTIATPLAGLGYGNVMLMNVSRSRATAPQQLGNALLATGVLGSLLVISIAALSLVLYDSRSSAILALVMGTTELLLVRSCLVAGQFFQSIDQIKRLSLINVSVSLCRVAAIFVLLILSEAQALLWASSCLALVFLLSLWHVPAAIRLAGGCKPHLGALKGQLSQASYFAFGTTAKATYTDLDKVILAREAPHAVLGVYNTAYRLVVMAFMPIRSLLDVSASKFFQVGEAGLKHSYAFSLKLLKFSVSYGVIVGLSLYFCAPLVPYILGPSYRDAVPILQWLAPLPVIQSIHYVLSDALTGAGHQRARTLAQLVILILYFVLAVLLIPAHGWQGAAIVCLISESCLAVLIFLIARHLLRRRPTSSPST
jgi:O-antigen/teichoic acid export membrane protein